MLPAELENVPDDFLHQLEWLLDLGLNQRGDVYDAHVHLQPHTQTAAGGKHTCKPHFKEGACEDDDKTEKRKRRSARGGSRMPSVEKNAGRERLPDKWQEGQHKAGQER